MKVFADYRLVLLGSVPTLNVLGIRQHFLPILQVATATKLATKFSLIAVQIMNSNAVGSNCSRIKRQYGNVSNSMK
jgi:hypothetical protein